jgi:toxin-antitoxin system PIN domain toxin
MKLVDVNILLYAVNDDDPLHDRIRSWWEESLRSSEPVGLAWSVLHGYLRLATHPRVFSRPQSKEEATDRVSKWLAHPNVQIARETDDHWHVLQSLVLEVGTIGNLVSDAHLAAIAISRAMTLVSCDRDFARFRQLRWENPAD